MSNVKPVLVLLIFGAVSFLLGVLLRLNSQEMAWPGNMSFTGSRENTPWAIREAALNDVAIALLAVGAGVIVVTAYAIASSSRAN